MVVLKEVYCIHYNKIPINTAFPLEKQYDIHVQPLGMGTQLALKQVPRL